MWYQKINGNSTTPEQQILLEEAVQGEALGMVHDHLWAGHQGIKNTQQRHKRKYFWPVIRWDERDYRWSCPICQQGNKRPPPWGPLYPLPLADRPSEQVAMDFIGPFPCTQRGAQYMLVDYAIQNREAVALPTTPAAGWLARCYGSFPRWDYPGLYSPIRYPRLHLP